MKKLISLGLSCLLLAGCVSKGVKPSHIPELKPLPSKALVISQPRQPTNIVQTVETNKPFSSFVVSKSPKIVEQTPKRVAPVTNTPALQNTNATNIIQTNSTTTDAIKPKKKSNTGITIGYYGIILSIGSFWLFFSKSKWSKKLRLLLTQRK